MKTSYWIAGALALAAVAWLASGMLSDRKAAEAAIDTQPAAAPGAVRVQATLYRAEPVMREVVVHGHTESRRSVVVRAETPGTLAETPLVKGTAVRAGEVIARLDAADRRERLEQAEALVRQRELEYQATRSLKSQNLNAERQVAEALALLEQARAELKGARLYLARAAVRAPFDGVLEQRAAEVGDYVGVGDPVATVVELDPLLASGDLSEQQVADIRPGMHGSVRLIDGRVFPAQVRYVARSAEVATRTFAVEMTLANPDRAIPAGMTAELRIPVGEVTGHRISAGLLSLDDAGRVGVKRVDGEGTVHFEPVEILRSEADAIWIGGLPAEARLITAGQGFVRAGDRVEVIESTR